MLFCVSAGLTFTDGVWRYVLLCCTSGGLTFSSIDIYVVLCALVWLFRWLFVFMLCMRCVITSARVSYIYVCVNVYVLPGVELERGQQTRAARTLPRQRLPT